MTLCQNSISQDGLEFGNKESVSCWKGKKMEVELMQGKFRKVEVEFAR
jgi:hypothetical protein